MHVVWGYVGLWLYVCVCVCVYAVLIGVCMMKGCVVSWCVCGVKFTCISSKINCNLFSILGYMLNDFFVLVYIVIIL